MEKDTKTKDQEDDSNYIGNIWGWKFSLWSLAIILLLTIWVLIRSQHAKNQNLDTQQPIEHVK